jgi:hypothetical protein
MAKRLTYIYYLIGGITLFGLVSFGQNVIRTETENRSYYTHWAEYTQPQKENLLMLMPESEVRKALLDMARKEVYVVEKTNNNDHPRISYYNKIARSSARAAYCAAGQYAMAKELGLVYNLKSPAAVRGWFTDKRTIVYNRGKWTSNAQLMDYIWIYGSHLEALAQPNIDPDIDDDDEILTIGFNTTAGTRKHGVHHPIWRRWGDVQLMTNQVTPAYLQLKNKYQ